MGAGSKRRCAMPNAEFLHKANKNKNDEFYTQYADIQKDV